MIPLLLALIGAGHAAPPAIYMVMVDRFSNGDEGNDADADPTDPAAFHGGSRPGGYGGRAEDDPIMGA